MRARFATSVTPDWFRVQDAARDATQLLGRTRRHGGPRNKSGVTKIDPGPEPQRRKDGE